MSFLFLHISSTLKQASLLQTPPVGLEGELIIIPFVLGVILDSKSLKLGSNCFVLSVFTKTGLAPVETMAFVVIIHVNGVVITSSPTPTPNDFRAMYKALLPEPVPTENLELKYDVLQPYFFQILRPSLVDSDVHKHLTSFVNKSNCLSYGYEN